MTIDIDIDLAVVKSAYLIIDFACLDYCFV